MSTKSPTPEAPSFIDRADAAASEADPVSALSLLVNAASTPTEAEYVTGLMLAADARDIDRSADRRIGRYCLIGTALVATARERINAGLATNTKGTKRDPLPAGSTLTFADVRDAFNLRGTGDAWSPNVPGAKPVGRTECQRYWEASSMTPDTIAAARALVKPEQANNARALVEAAATAARDAKLTTDERAKRETKRIERETAKSEADAAAKRADERITAARHPDAGGASLVSDDMAAEATLADLVATMDAIAAAIDKRHAEAEAIHSATVNADAMIEALALARGVSVDDMRAILDTLPASA